MRNPAARRRPGPGRLRPVPERSADFAHVSLSALREYRQSLLVEEDRVSYWRRLVQARIDLLDDRGGEDTVHTLRRVFGREANGARTALVHVLPLDDLPPLPDLARLWERPAFDSRAAGVAELREALGAAERQLSDYRRALHARIDAATGELIARYREDPAQCLVALPDTGALPLAAEA